MSSLNPKLRLKSYLTHFGLFVLHDSTFKALLECVSHLTFLNKCHNILATGGTLIPWTMVAYLWT